MAIGFDADKTFDIETSSGRLKCRPITGRMAKEIGALSRGNAELPPEQYHERMDKALAVGLVDFDPSGLTLGEKVVLVEEYPWAQYAAEMKEYNAKVDARVAAKAAEKAKAKADPNDTTL